MSQLIEFYKDVLSLANLVPDEKGYIRATTKDKPIVTVENRLWVLPTQEHQTTLTSDKEIFHPLSENTILRLSKTMEVFTYRVNGALNTRFAELAFGLKNFCSSPAKQANISKAQLNIARSIQYEEEIRKEETGIDPFLSFLLNQLSKNPSETFVNISLARGGFYKGVKKSRVGIVTFPFYRKLKEDEDKTKKESEIQNLSKKHIKLLIQIYEAIFPGLDISEEYNYACEGGPAPFFVTLMQSAGGLSDAMNLVLEAFENEDGFSELNSINMKWKKVVDSHNEMQRLSRFAPNTEVEQISEKQSLTPIPIETKPTPTVSTQQETSIPYAGPVVVQPPGFQQTQPQQVSQQTGLTGRQPTGRPRVPYEDWAKKSAQPSQMGVNASMTAAVQRYNQAYEQYYATHMRQYGVAPANMPHPSNIPKGALAPYFHGAPPMPQLPGAPQQGYPQQGFPQQGYSQQGYPQMQAPPVMYDQYGRPMMTPQPNVYMGQQVSMSPNAWGQPQQPQVGWGQPQQQPQTTWGQSQQPQANWGGNQNSGNSIIPGTI